MGLLNIICELPHPVGHPVGAHFAFF